MTRVVEWCKRQGLNIVLDLHKAYGYDFNNAGDKEKNILFTNKMVQKRFVNLWIKIAEHYANETHVAFELLNEVVEQENAEAWNLLIAETVDNPWPFRIPHTSQLFAAMKKKSIHQRSFRISRSVRS